MDETTLLQTFCRCKCDPPGLLLYKGISYVDYLDIEISR